MSLKDMLNDSLTPCEELGKLSERAINLTYGINLYLIVFNFLLIVFSSFMALTIKKNCSRLSKCKVI